MQIVLVDCKKLAEFCAVVNDQKTKIEFSKAEKTKWQEIPIAIEDPFGIVNRFNATLIE